MTRDGRYASARAQTRAAMRVGVRPCAPLILLLALIAAVVLGILGMHGSGSHHDAQPVAAHGAHDGRTGAATATEAPPHAAPESRATSPDAVAAGGGDVAPEHAGAIAVCLLALLWFIAWRPASRRVGAVVARRMPARADRRIPPPTPLGRVSLIALGISRT